MADSYDAIVIGGGVIGASVLFQLTSLGCRRALLLDRDQLAGGMTAHSSGIVRTHYSVPINVRVAEASLRMLESLPELLDDPEAQSGLVRSGYLILAPPGDRSDAVRASIAMQRSLGIEARLLGSDEARARHPWLQLDDIDAIGFEAEAGYADPYMVTMAFARAARRRGATIRTGTAVTGLLLEGDRVRGVRTAAGDIEAPITLSAVNVWSERVAAWAGIAIPLDITAHHVFTLSAARPYARDLPIVKDLASASRFYTRPSGGHLLVGGGHEGDRTEDPDVADLNADPDAILNEAGEVAHRFPAFADGHLVRSWSGLYDTTPDWNPVLGPVAGLSGLSLAFGFSGHGFKLSPMLGRMIAQGMLGMEPDLPLHPYRLSRYAEGEPLVGGYGAGAVS